MPASGTSAAGGDTATLFELMANIVSERGLELDLTLIVRGTLISGTLTAAAFIPGDKEKPLPGSEAGAVKVVLDELHASGTKFRDPLIVLRNAIVVLGGSATPVPFDQIAINPRSVDGLTFGRYGVHDR
jgi:hypothetical protein